MVVTFLWNAPGGLQGCKGQLSRTTITTTRVFIQLFWWPLSIQTTNLCGVDLVFLGISMMPSFSSLETCGIQFKKACYQACTMCWQCINTTINIGWLSLSTLYLAKEIILKCCVKSHTKIHQLQMKSSTNGSRVCFWATERTMASALRKNKSNMANVRISVLACIVLHNFCIMQKDTISKKLDLTFNPDNNERTDNKFEKCPKLENVKKWQMF